MSSQTYASENDPYWLSTRGVDSISFNKQASDPLAFLNKGILYEKTDGLLYFNGVPISGSSGGDVSSSSDPSLDNAIARFDGTTGKVIKDSLTTIDSTINTVALSHSTADGMLPVLTTSNTSRDLKLGFYAGPDLVGTINNTIIGSRAMRFSEGGNNNTVVGAFALFNTGDGAGGSGSNNTSIGVSTLGSHRGNFATAIGDSSQSGTNTTPLQIPNTSCGAWSMRYINGESEGNNAFGWRALQGDSSLAASTGSKFNNAFGNYNGLTAFDGFSYNNMFGNSCLNSAPAAFGNCIFGNGGESYTTGNESFNILLGNGTGVNGDNRTIRIGAASDALLVGVAKPTDCYIQGIHNRSPAISTERKIVSVDATGKLYGSSLGAAMPYCWGYFQDYTSLYLAVISTINVPVPISPTLTFNSAGSGFFTLLAPGVIAYQGADLVNAMVSIQMSCKLAAGTNENIEFEIYKNGITVPGSRVRRRLTSSVEYGCCTLSCIVPNLSTGSAIQLWITNVSGTNDIEFGNINITVETKL